MNNSVPKFFILIPLLSSSLLLIAQINENQVEAFAAKYAAENNIPKTEIMDLLSKAQFQQTIVDKMDRPPEKKMTWSRYRNIFIQQERINAGIEFVKNHQVALTAVSESTGVPVEIIAAIIGVESYFGRIKGSTRVLDALYTLSFGYPRRASYFQSELSAYITLTREEQLDIFSLKGSYAGAMGYCQFMPTSYEAYAVSYDDGNRDLIHSAEDAIASVGNYLKVHRWESNQPVATPATKQPDAQSLEKQSVKPNNTLSYYLAKGYEPQANWDSAAKASLIEFETESLPEYWFVANNFYVITRYNHSPLYALAVFQLAEAIKDPTP